MAIPRKGDVLICGEVVREGSVPVLRYLAESSTPVAVPEIGDALQEPHSDAELYSILDRLMRRPSLLIRIETDVLVRGKNVRRVLWETTPAVKQFFLENSSK